MTLVDVNNAPLSRGLAHLDFDHLEPWVAYEVKNAIADLALGVPLTEEFQLAVAQAAEKLTDPAEQAAVMEFLSVSLTAAFNPLQARVPKGNGRLSGRWIDMPGTILYRLFDSYPLNDQNLDPQIAGALRTAKHHLDNVSDPFDSGSSGQFREMADALRLSQFPDLLAAAREIDDFASIDWYSDPDNPPPNSLEQSLGQAGEDWSKRWQTVEGGPAWLDYVVDQSEKVNRWMRTGEYPYEGLTDEEKAEFDKDYGDFSATIEGLYGKTDYRIPADGTVYRVFMPTEEFNPTQLTEGKIFTERAFLSTSGDPEFARKKAPNLESMGGDLSFMWEMDIAVPAGAQYLPGPASGENEAIFYPGAHLRVDSIDWDNNHIKMTMVAPGNAEEPVIQAKLDAIAGDDLAGLPAKPQLVPNVGMFAFHSNKELQDLAGQYMATHAVGSKRPTDYVKVHPEVSAKIAQAFEDMPNDPNDPAVAKAYKALKDETLAQYQSLVDAGFVYEFYPEGADPYPNSPREAIMDLTFNHHMFVYPTHAGFGTESHVDDNPLLETVPNLTWNGKPVTYNDVFRAVHDSFGHAQTGVGFRGDGEDNAYREHYAMFSDEARKALASETRGQNSWLNYGPHGATNRTAGIDDTIFADQKAGILPDWARDPELHRVDPTGDRLDPNFIDFTYRTSDFAELWSSIDSKAAMGGGELLMSDKLIKALGGFQGAMTPAIASDGANPLLGTVNCQMAVLAYELRRRGFNVVARRGQGGGTNVTGWETWLTIPSPVSDHYESIPWLNWPLPQRVTKDGSDEVWRLSATEYAAALDKQRHEVSDNLQSIIERFPPGSRGFTELWWLDPDGTTNGKHIMNWERLDDGTPILIDPQTNKPIEFYHGDPNQMTWKSNPAFTSVVRVDDLVINDVAAVRAVIPPEKTYQAIEAAKALQAVVDRTQPELSKLREARGKIGPIYPDLDEWNSLTNRITELEAEQEAARKVLREASRPVTGPKDDR